jgi:SNF2 family DNA or RNA helicase
MLLSIMTGSVGLNLTGANNMIICDLNWNPQLECQVMNRIHRFGQVKDVVITKFICYDTIEERILELQEEKLKIADSTLDRDRAFFNQMTVEELQRLFAI